MTMAIGAVGGVLGGTVGAVSGGVLGGSPVAGVAGAGGEGGFAGVLGRALDGVQATQAKADGLAKLAATGQLNDIHDYTIAASQAQLVTELAVAVRNKSVEAFNELMRMPV